MRADDSNANRVEDGRSLALQMSVVRGHTREPGQGGNHLCIGYPSPVGGKSQRPRNFLGGPSCKK